MLWYSKGNRIQISESQYKSALATRVLSKHGARAKTAFSSLFNKAAAMEMLNAKKWPEALENVYVRGYLRFACRP